MSYSSTILSISLVCEADILPRARPLTRCKTDDSFIDANSWNYSLPWPLSTCPSCEESKQGPARLDKPKLGVTPYNILYKHEFSVMTHNVQYALRACQTHPASRRYGSSLLLLVVLLLHDLWTIGIGPLVCRVNHKSCDHQGHNWFDGLVDFNEELCSPVDPYLPLMEEQNI